MKLHDPKSIVVQFNDCINNRDIIGLEMLMTDDHTFIDTESNIVNGKQACLEVWKSFFKMLPDYKNIFDKITENKNLIIMTGHSACSDKRLEGPAIWTAKAESDKVSEWRVYVDSPDVRQLFIP